MASEALRQLLAGIDLENASEFLQELIRTASVSSFGALSTLIRIPHSHSYSHSLAFAIRSHIYFVVCIARRTS